MNAWEDLERRVYFMLRELRSQQRDAGAYTLVVSRDVFATALNQAPDLMRTIYFQNQARLLGFPLVLADHITNFVALRHEVRG